MFPAGNPSKSSGSQPLVDVLSGPRCEVDGRDRGGDVAGVGLVDHAEVHVLDVGDRAGGRLLESRGPEDRKAV